MKPKQKRVSVIIPCLDEAGVIEDLLRVEGVNRGLFDQVRDYLVVVEGSRGGANWSAAPENLMGVLREADPRKAAAIEATFR